MDVSFTLWSLRALLEKIPFDLPATGPIDIDFSDIAVPYYIKKGFRVSIEYEDSLPYEATCSIYSPKNIVTIVLIMQKKYETAFKTWLDNHDTKFLHSSCLRRELYCHEACHLVAIIRAFPGDRYSKVRKDFLEKIHKKFEESLRVANGAMTAPFISMERADVSPSVFSEEHFRYGDDNLNYFRLYQELMIDYDKMSAACKTICANICGTGKTVITSDDIAQETLVSEQFFKLFPEKFNDITNLLRKELKRMYSSI